MLSTEPIGQAVPAATATGEQIGEATGDIARFSPVLLVASGAVAHALNQQSNC